jgi:hypothetical protein
MCQKAVDGGTRLRQDRLSQNKALNASIEASGLLTVGFLLIVAIYVQVAILFGVYTPELFPTEVRLRANGICNTIGRAPRSPRRKPRELRVDDSRMENPVNCDCSHRRSKTATTCL